MLTICIRQKLLSGNRGRDNTTATTEQDVPSTQPKQSTRSFVPPVAGSVKKSPSVKEYIHDPVVTETVDTAAAQANETEVAQPEEPAVVVETAKPEETTPVVATETVTSIPAETEVLETVEVIEEENIEPETVEVVPIEPTEEKEQLTFIQHWEKIVDLYFEKVPTVYYALKKEYIPEIVDNVVQIKVKNQLQKEDIDVRIREILSYLRNNFDNSIDNVEVHVDGTIASKAKIMDARDKMNLLNEQNKSLPEFLQILKLTIKE